MKVTPYMNMYLPVFDGRHYSDIIGEPRHRERGKHARKGARRNRIVASAYEILRPGHVFLRTNNNSSNFVLDAWRVLTGPKYCIQSTMSKSKRKKLNIE